jgi:hypothetical protein
MTTFEDHFLDQLSMLPSPNTGGNRVRHIDSWLW